MSNSDIRDVRSIRAEIALLSNAANSAHFGSSLSCVEILSAIVLASNIKSTNLEAADRDRIIVSKGHAAMAYYAVLKAYGLIDSALLKNYLADDTRLWGHITCTTCAPIIDASTGSLGHGLGIAAGYAEAYRLRNHGGRMFCVLSDGELDEGSTWEAALYAGARKVAALNVVVDYNKIQSLDHVDNVLPLEPLADKWRSFGWDTEEVDGHNIGALLAALEPRLLTKPRVVIAHTIKGRGIPRIENTVGSHYRPATKDDIAVLE